MTLYETIFVRRAVRKYDDKPLDDKTLAELQAFLDTSDRMARQEARFEIVPTGAVKGMAAPHYILTFCKADACAYANVGYVLSNCDLYLQSRGLGSIFLGMAKPVKDRDDFCILLALGNSDVPFRTGEEDFNRLPITEISNADNPVAHAARISPSAMNSQPWRLNFNDGTVTVSYFGRGISQMILKKKMSKVDVGIASRHVVVALQNEGKEIVSVTPRMDNKSLTVEITYR